MPGPGTLTNHMTTNVLPNLKSLPYGGASAAEYSVISQEITNIMRNAPVTEWLNDSGLHHRFLDRYRQWIQQSRLNYIQGLDSFPVAAYSLGTSEAFDKFYLRNRTRRFRCLRGEYMYHAASWRNYFPDWRYIEDGPLEPNDALVLSLPFSDTGDVHGYTQMLLNRAGELSVPVLVDMAFFGACRDISVDLAHPAITDVTFSLSKTFPVSHVRIGMRLTRTDDDDSLMVHHKSAYVNRLGAGLGLELMNQWSADFNSQHWGALQQRFCNQLGVAPSKTVLFGVDTKNTHSEYNRGTNTNRLCFARYFERGRLFE